MSENETRIQELIEEVIATFRRLRVVSAELHGDGTPMPGQRGVLIDLDRVGPQTVANIARARAVSRQHIQALVNGFRARGLVEFAENPNHRRSKLVRLTRNGRALVKAMLKRESAALGSRGLVLPPAQIRSAVKTLQTLRQQLQHRKGTK
jgi:DNA-binding MarR family transcriptional regulator